MTDTNLKIGYMPLAHRTYWKFFPEHKAPTLKLAGVLRDYLSQFGAVYETGELIDAYPASVEARRLFQANDVDVIVLATVTFSTPDDVILDLKKFRRPTVVWNTQASAGIPADLSFDTWMLEHGVTGVPGLANLLFREKIPYFLVSGHFSGESVKRRFTEIFDAVSAAGHVWGSRVGMFGHTYPGMIDFGYDPTSMYTTFGVATVPVLESAVLSAYQAVKDDEVDRLAAEVMRKYGLADEFQGNEFVNSVRLAVAMREVAREKELTAATVYCQQLWQNADIGVVACLGMSLLSQQGIFCTCEGDIPTALAGMILEKLSGRAVFTEIWANDFENDQFLMGHSGQMNLGLFENDTRAVKMARHPWWDGCAGRGVCFHLQMPPGPITMLSITSVRDGRWRLVTSRAEVLTREAVPLGAPNYFISTGCPIPEFMEKWAESGAAHHLAMAYGDWTNQLKAFARIMDVEYHQV
jgi:L-arabinose isomerase